MTRKPKLIYHKTNLGALPDVMFRIADGRGSYAIVCVYDGLPVVLVDEGAGNEDITVGDVELGREVARLIPMSPRSEIARARLAEVAAIGVERARLLREGANDNDAPRAA